MSRVEDLAAAYTRARPRLLRVAYAILGVHAEAEDVVQDCWFRLADADSRDRVLDVDAWATVTVARRALDVLRSARARHETYVGPWLPEPQVGPLASPAPAQDPAERVTLDETVGYALLVVLETLTPAERTAWVLHDLFGMPFAEVGAAVGRSPAAVRQLASRARAHVAAGVPRMDVDDEQHRSVVQAFTRAAAEGDLAGLLALLDEDVVLTSDGGGVVQAARRPVTGADKVGRFLVGVAAKAGQGSQIQFVAVNGMPGVLLLVEGRPALVGALAVRDGRVQRVDLVLAPAKLAHVRPPGGTVLVEG